MKIKDIKLNLIMQYQAYFLIQTKNECNKRSFPGPAFFLFHFGSKLLKLNKKNEPRSGIYLTV